MSSKKSSKLDLLVRVRYSNPLPPPPFPPKLLAIPTHPSRYAAFDFTSRLADETPFPMIVDAELGMPLDLKEFEGLWDYEEGEGEDYDLNPDPNNLPILDPADEALVADLAEIASSSGGPAAASSSTGQSMKVSWLRTNQHIGSSASTNIPSIREVRMEEEEPIPDVSHSAQISSIQSSFHSPLTSSDLSKLRHPTKKHLRAVESYEVFPDQRIWANAYDLVKFSERPGERDPEEEDPRLETAIIRPVVSEEGDSYLSYYLTPSDSASVLSTAQRRSAFQHAAASRTNSLLANSESVEEPERISFNFVRDYETVKIDMDVPNEFLLSIDDGDAGGARGEKGAFYKNIERKYVLKKRKRAIGSTDDTSDKWDIIHITHEPFTEEVWAERDEAAAEVCDSDFLTKVQQAEEEADGMDVDVDGGANGVNGAKDEKETNGHAHGDGEDGPLQGMDAPITA